MDQKRRFRGAIRSQVSRILNEVDREFEQEEKDETKLEGLFARLTVQHKKLNEADEEYLNLLLDNDVHDDELSLETEETGDYQQKIEETFSKMRKIVKPEVTTASPPRSASPSNYSTASGASMSAQLSYRLPKIEI